MAGVHARHRAGIALIVASCVALAFVPVGARLAYADGVDITTLLTLRAAVGLVLVGGLAMATMQGLRMTRPGLLASIGAGIFYAGMSLGYIGAVAFITPALASFIYYLHPVLLVLGGAVMARRRPPAGTLAPVAVALAGLALLLSGGVELQADPRGLILSAGAAVSVCGMIVMTARAQRTDPVLAVNAVSIAVTLAVYLAVLALRGEAALPRTPLGWGGVLIAGIAMAAGIVLFFAAVTFVSATEAAVISLLEPAMVAVLAAWLLGEHLSAPQWLGAAVVILALGRIEVAAARKSGT